MSEIKRMSVKEFRELGLLQMINRKVLHPMGLALEVIVNFDTKGQEFGEVWDYRDDPEGMAFDEGEIDAEKAETAEAMFESKRSVREEKFGWHVQPVDVVIK